MTLVICGYGSAFSSALEKLAASDLMDVGGSPDQGFSGKFNTFLRPSSGGGPAAPSPTSPAAAPVPQAGPRAASPTGGFISQSLTPAAGGGTHQYSRQTPMDPEAVRGIAKKQGIDPARLEQEFVSASGRKSPADVSRFWNTMNVESGFRNKPGDRGTSVGIGQIHLPAHPEFKGWDLNDPYVNARAAGQVVKQQGFSGAYKTTSARFGYPKG